MTKASAPRPLWLPVLVILLILSVLLNGILIALVTKKPVVNRVVDGDSVDLSDGRRIRLLSIDAPELGRCKSEEARSALEELALGKAVSLKDPVTDDYGRTLANAYAGGKLLNAEMVRLGMAKFVSVKSPEFATLKTASIRAKEQKLGIYSEVCRAKDPTTDCTIKGNLRAGKKSYYPSDCRQYNSVIIDTSFGDRWFCSRDEAEKAGFELSASCLH